MRTLQATLFSLGQPHRANAISYKSIGLAALMDWEAEVVEELCRLAVHHLAKPELRSQMLPPSIEGLVSDLEAPLLEAFPAVLNFAQDESLLDHQIVSTPRNIIQILTELRS
jgi:hypothetical protein